jgi:lipopolysaccharide/colanic/teichoic acid biosynthesis glycosyltransferase
MTELKCVKITYRNNDDSYFLEQASSYKYKYKNKLNKYSRLLLLLLLLQLLLLLILLLLLLIIIINLTGTTFSRLVLFASYSLLQVTSFTLVKFPQHV